MKYKGWYGWFEENQVKWRRNNKSFNNTSDLVTYEFETSSNIKVLICYIEGLINKDLLDRDIIKPIINNLNSPKDIKSVLYVSNLNEIDLIEDEAGEMTYGSIGIFIMGLISVTLLV